MAPRCRNQALREGTIEMSSDILINIFDDLEDAQVFARGKLDLGFDVTVTGKAPDVSINQTIKDKTKAVPINHDGASFVVLAFNKT
jgi:hypothetical protein